MIISLVILHWLLANEWEMQVVYNLYGGLAMLTFGLYLGWMAIQKNTEKKYVYEYQG